MIAMPAHLHSLARQMSEMQISMQMGMAAKMLGHTIRIHMSQDLRRRETMPVPQCYLHSHLASSFLHRDQSLPVKRRDQ